MAEMALGVFLPPPRCDAFVASSRGRLYLWGGQGGPKRKEVYIYSVNTEIWLMKVTNGFHLPVGLTNGGCSAAGRHIYLYGGYEGSHLFGSLCQINTDDLTCRELFTMSAEGPLRKSGCRMITFEDQLFLLGGYYGHCEPDYKQPGSRYENGYTNELHCYNLKKGSWSSPVVTGSSPPSAINFSLTMIDEEHAVMFGGCRSNSNFSADVHVLNLPTMYWSCLQHSPGDPWPEGRSNHIAVCLGYGGQHKKLLISGGLNGPKVLSDTWLLDPLLSEWKEVLVPNDTIVQRWGHSAASLTVTPECEEVVLFGGQHTYFGSVIGETTVLRFESQDTHSSGMKHWFLTDVADHTQLGLPERLDDKKRRMEYFSVEELVGKLRQQLENKAQESNRKAEESEKRAKESGRRAEELEGRTVELEKRAKESDKEAEELKKKAEEFDKKAGESNRRARQLERELVEIRQQQESGAETQRTLDEMRERLRVCQNLLRAYDTQWVVARQEIELTGPELGRGAWATVSVAKFRGLKVAAKRIHNMLVSPHNIQLFRREMNIAARVRHPNLVQFIGATLEGDMIILMEFMSTSLRNKLEAGESFHPMTVKSMILDIARALNYLHLMQPVAIIHRDISSANVLLEQLPLNRWKAKVTDYGSANLLHQLSTKNPGGPAYAAPEADSPRRQSPKMDIYSFGALILEMSTGRLPVPHDRLELFSLVQDQQLLRLIRRCLSEHVEDRPDASGIIARLS